MSILLRRRAKAVFVVGQCADRIAQAAQGVSVFHCETLEEATERAYGMATTGDKVMLAPACASWDMFPSYKVRGERFRQAARRICRAAGGRTDQPSGGAGRT